MSKELPLLQVSYEMSNNEKSAGDMKSYSKSVRTSIPEQYIAYAKNLLAQEPESKWGSGDGAGVRIRLQAPGAKTQIVSVRLASLGSRSQQLIDQITDQPEQVFEVWHPQSGYQGVYVAIPPIAKAISESSESSLRLANKVELQWS